MKNRFINLFGNKFRMLTFRFIISSLLWALLVEFVQTQSTTSSYTGIPPTPTVAKTSDKTKATLDDYKALLDYLFSKDGSLLGPRYNLSEKADVSIYMHPYLIEEMDTAKQTLQVAMLMHVTWTNEILVWDPAAYGGVDSVTIPLEKIWHPKLTMMANKLDKVDDAQSVFMTSSGFAAWFHQEQIRLPCAVDVTFYPFDIQTCRLTTHLSPLTGSVATLGQPPGLPSKLLLYENSEWQLEDFKSRLVYQGIKGYIESSFIIRRRIAFNIYTMLMPLVALSIINTFTILVPISSGDKGSIAVTIFLAYGFFATLIRDVLPHNSLQISSYLIYMCVLVLISMSTCVYTMVQSRIYSKYGNKTFKFPFFNSPTSAASVDGNESSQNVEKEGGTLSGIKEEIRHKITMEEVLSKVDMFVFLALIFSLIVLNAVCWIQIALARQE